MAKSEAQMLFRCPQALRDRLESVAGRRGLAEEIRVRLEWSFDFQDMEPKTLDLVEMLVAVAGICKRDFGGQWHDDPSRREAFRKAVNLLIDRLAVKGSPEQLSAREGSLPDIVYGNTISPGDAGKYLGGAAAGEIDMEKRTGSGDEFTRKRVRLSTSFERMGRS